MLKKELVERIKGRKKELVEKNSISQKNYKNDKTLL